MLEPVTVEVFEWRIQATRSDQKRMPPFMICGKSDKVPSTEHCFFISHKSFSFLVSLYFFKNLSHDRIIRRSTLR